MPFYSENPLSVQIREMFGMFINIPPGRFRTVGWRYQGKTMIPCDKCESAFEIFRKPYQTTQGDYEYWAIICLKCKKCFELKEFDSMTRRRLFNWSKEETFKQDQIRGWWEKAHGVLKPDQRKRFLKHPTLTKLIFLDAKLIKYAIENLRFMKLDEIFGYVHGKSLEVTYSQRPLYETKEEKIKGGRKYPAKKTRKIYKSVERGRQSFRKFGTVNPPPAKHPDLRGTSLYKCSVCEKPVVGNSCACDGW